MFPVAKIIFLIFIAAFVTILLSWWIFKPLGKAARKTVKQIKKDILDDEDSI